MLNFVLFCLTLFYILIVIELNRPVNAFFNKVEHFFVCISLENNYIFLYNEIEHRFETNFNNVQQNILEACLCLNKNDNKKSWN